MHLRAHLFRRARLRLRLRLWRGIRRAGTGDWAGARVHVLAVFAARAARGGVEVAAGLLAVDEIAAVAIRTPARLVDAGAEVRPVPMATAPTAASTATPPTASSGPSSAGGHPEDVRTSAHGARRERKSYRNHL